MVPSPAPQLEMARRTAKQRQANLQFANPAIHVPKTVGFFLPDQDLPDADA
jgi:hypothetical protein